MELSCVNGGLLSPKLRGPGQVSSGIGRWGSQAVGGNWPPGLMSEYLQGVYAACCCPPSGSKQRREGGDGGAGRRGEEEGLSTWPGTSFLVLPWAIVSDLKPWCQKAAPQAPTTGSTSLFPAGHPTPLP